MRLERAPRADYTNRGASRQGITYIATGVAPHALTTRATYTVPTGKLAKITSASLGIAQIGQPTSTGDVEARFDINTTHALMLIIPGSFLNFEEANISIGEAGDAFAGEALTLKTADNSAGGATSWRLTVCLVAYSA